MNFYIYKKILILTVSIVFAIDFNTYSNIQISNCFAYCREIIDHSCENICYRNLDYCFTPCRIDINCRRNVTKTLQLQQEHLYHSNLYK